MATARQGRAVPGPQRDQQEERDDRLPGSHRHAPGSVLVDRRSRPAKASRSPTSAGSRSMREVHIIGVPLDLGGGRRGVDMGPSALRIAGIGEQAQRARPRGPRSRRSGHTHPGDRGRRRSITSAIWRKSPGSATTCTSGLRLSSAVGATPLVLGGDHSVAAGSVSATADHARRRGAAARAHLGGRAWRHEHARHHAERQRPRDAARGAARARTGRAGQARRLRPEGRSGPHGARRRPQPRRAREDRRPRIGRPRLHDEGHRSAGHRPGRRTSHRVRVGRDDRRARLVRRGRLRPGDCARGGDAGQGRSRTIARRTWSWRCWRTPAP